MARRTIPDGSGARVTLQIINSATHTSHIHQFHVDALDSGSGLYTDADSGGHPENSVFTTVTNYMTALQPLFTTAVTMQFIEVLAVTGTPAKPTIYIPPPGPIASVLGTTTQESPSRASVSTLTTLDTYRNRVRLVYAGCANADWTPNSIYIPVLGSSTNAFDVVASYLLGYVGTTVGRVPRIVTRAGNPLVNRFRVVPSLNRRLRREYNLV